VLCLTVPSLQLARNRGHFVNVFFLERYLKQQAEHIGFNARNESDAKKLEEEFSGPTVSQQGTEQFRAGGFVWSLDDFYKNALVFGQPGSGKTACVLNALLEGAMLSTQGTGQPISGLILDPKGDFRTKVEILCRKLGREDDLYVLDPDSWPTQSRSRRSIAWNP